MLVMLLGKGKRNIQKKLLPIPIGLLTHLILDGTWTQKEIFWWPITGRDLVGDEVDRLEFSLLPTGIILEMLAVAFAVYGFKKFRLREQANRSALIKKGHLLALEGN